MIFNVGDYIGDEYDTCWKVESVTEKEYAIVYIPGNIRKTISREKSHTDGLMIKIMLKIIIFSERIIIQILLNNLSVLYGNAIRKADLMILRQIQ